ncbi:hypothetical protein [Mucilaginibacter sp. NFX135]|uniref:hypothetical protein n=1 Tax=Mucilaginibacter sp. NFX135 TaxID=3402687 RepID=UPI003AFA392A
MKGILPVKGVSIAGTFLLTHITRNLLLIALCTLCSFGYGQTSIIDTGIMPQVFAPGVISTPYSEWSTSFTPDGQTVYSSQGSIYWTIVFSKRQNGQWMKPKVASFSGKFRDTDPFVTPDGKKIFFISNRPPKGKPQDKSLQAEHIWYTDHLPGDAWDTPQQLDSVINLTGISNYAPSVSAKGTLFYCSRRKGLTGMQSFYAAWLGSHYDKPRQLIIPGVSEIQDPFIAPDESYLVFLSGNDIYISFKQNNNWGQAQKLGPAVNNGDGNSSPYVSADGKTLYYSSNRMQGFYKRDLKKPALNYDELIKENNSLFNSQGNILMIPIHLPQHTGSK